MSVEPSWLNSGELIELNSHIVERTSEPHHVVIDGALEAACDRAHNAFSYGEDDIVILACTTLMAVADAHAFMQGNKRTALLGMELFLRKNGYTFDAPDIRIVSQAIIDCVNGALSFGNLVEFFDGYIVEHDDAAASSDLLAGMPTQLPWDVITTREQMIAAGYAVVGPGEIGVTKTIPDVSTFKRRDKD